MVGHLVTEDDERRLSDSLSPSSPSAVAGTRDKAEQIVAANIEAWGWGPLADIEGLSEHQLAVDACEAGLSAALQPQSSEELVVAWRFELARAMDRVKDTYHDWGPPQVALTKPCVPEGSIRNLTPLYSSAAIAAIAAIDHRSSSELVEELRAIVAECSNPECYICEKVRSAADHIAELEAQVARYREALERSVEVMEFAYMNAPEQPREIAEARATLASQEGSTNNG